MRILFTFVGGRGHLEPLVPLADAARTAGHTVSFACAPEMATSVRAAGFPVLALGPEPPSGPAPVRRLPLRPVDSEREERELRERFVRKAARLRAPLVRAACETWHPDVLVCDETDFGALLASELLGIPYAVVLVIGAGAFVRPDVVGPALDELRAEHGLAPDPGLEMLRRHLVLSFFPPGFRDPSDPLPATALCLRPPGAPGARRSSQTRRVYATLGTVFNTESGDLLARVTAGLRELPVDLTVSTGEAVDPGELGPQPAHVRVQRFVPQAELLPHCDLVVCHAGSGSVQGALAHGLPLVLIPLGADQPGNAERCAALGVAEVLDAMEVTPERVRAAASRVLADPVYRRNAERIRDEMGALPDVAAAVEALEGLAR